MSYRVSTQVYSGPFDLLLQLVTRQKVDIGAISISEVAEQYLAEAERIEALDLDVASDFLLVAATLLDIKAASLVPQEAPRKTGDGDEDDEDLEELSALDGDALREVLIQRLIAYKQFKGAAAALGARMQAESRMHPRVAGPDPDDRGNPIGLVYLGIAWGDQCVVKALRAGTMATRERVRNQAAQHSLDLLRRHLTGLPLEES